MEFKSITPDPKCFQNSVFERLGNYPFYPFEKVDYDENRGILVYYQGCKLPKHGFPFPEAVKAINVIKRTALVIFRNVSWFKILFKRKQMVDDFVHLGNQAMAGMDINDTYLCPVAKEVKKLLNLIFADFKINPGLAHIIAQIFEHDNAYRYFLQDIMNEIKPEDLLERKTYSKLIELIRQRAKQSGTAKFVRPLKIVSLMLFYPKFKHSLKKALEQINFKNLQFDDFDYYWMLERDDYDFFGRDYQSRITEWKEANGGEFPKKYIVQM
jgi:hypothetical protein